MTITAPSAKKARTFSFLDNTALNMVLVFPAGTDTTRAENALEAFDLLKLPDAIRDRLALAGLRTVLQQRTSDTDAGPAKLVAMRNVYNYWRTTAQWEKPREGFTGNRVPAWLPSAIQAAKGCSSSIALASANKAALSADKEQWAALLAKYAPFREEAGDESVDLLAD
jgi:hypothetical protein